MKALKKKINTANCSITNTSNFDKNKTNILSYIFTQTNKQTNKHEKLNTPLHIKSPIMKKNQTMLKKKAKYILSQKKPHLIQINT